MGCNTVHCAGNINILEFRKLIVYFWKLNSSSFVLIPGLSGSMALTTLLAFHAERVEINLSFLQALTWAKIGNNEDQKETFGNKLLVG